MKEEPCKTPPKDSSLSPTSEKLSSDKLHVSCLLFNQSKKIDNADTQDNEVENNWNLTKKNPKNSNVGKCGNKIMKTKKSVDYNSRRVKFPKSRMANHKKPYKVEILKNSTVKSSKLSKRKQFYYSENIMRELFDKDYNKNFLNKLLPFISGEDGISKLLHSFKNKHRKLSFKDWKSFLRKVGETYKQQEVQLIFDQKRFDIWVDQNQSIGGRIRRNMYLSSGQSGRGQYILFIFKEIQKIYFASIKDHISKTYQNVEVTKILSPNVLWHFDELQKLCQSFSIQYYQHFKIPPPSNDDEKV